MEALFWGPWMMLWLCDFAAQISMLILKSKPCHMFHFWRIDFLVPFEVRAEIEVRSIRTFQPQEMHSAKGISGNDDPVIMRHAHGGRRS